MSSEKRSDRFVRGARAAICCVMAICLSALALAQSNTFEIPAAPSASMPAVNAPAVTPPAPAAPSPLLQQSVPALTLPPGHGQQAPPAAPADAGPPPTPNLEFTAVEAVKGAQAGTLDERLKPFKKILDKLAPNCAFRVVSQEAKEAPYSQETAWDINGQYQAYVLPMEQTPEGAVRVDSRVAVNQNGQQVNALRAEGDLPQRKAMAFRGLAGSDGSELILFLGQKQDEQDNQESSESDNQDQEEQESEESEAKQGKQDEDSKEQSEEEQQDAAQQEQEMAKAEEKEAAEAQDEEKPEGAENIEALLKSLEEEDQRQQADARFDRKTIKLPPSGEWW